MNKLYNFGLTDRFINLATEYSDKEIARVVSQHKGLYRIVLETGERRAEISGKMRYETNELALFPTVGDFVMASIPDENSNAIIHNLLPRKSVFLRTAVGVSGQAQPVVANVDTLFICMSLNNNFNLNRLERYLAIAWDSKVNPVILLTKSDQCREVDRYTSEAERVSFYSDVITISMFDEEIEKKFEKYLQVGSTAAFVGSSGVGKSTVINLLQKDRSLTTAEVGKADKGRHTTTGREMYTSVFGGVIIDTPGMRELGAESVDLSQTFSDIDEIAKNCRYSDCKHESEPGCAVNLAVLEGEIDTRHLENYKKLKVEAGYEGLSSREIEEKKFERFGGVRNLRKIGDQMRKNKLRKD